VQVAAESRPSKEVVVAQGFVAKSLTTLCEQNSGRGGVFRVAGASLQLVASTAGIDQAFLDRAQLLWRVSEASEGPCTDGRLSLFRSGQGVIVLDGVDEASCPPRLRSLLLEGIAQAMEQTPTAGLEQPFAGEAPPSWLEAIPEDELERHRLLARLGAADWNVARVARREGMSRRGLYYKLERLGIRRPTLV
jgi:hypothetical protein